MNRRDATLALLGRLHERRLRLRAAELAPLQEQAACLDAEAGELERRRREEGSVMLSEALPYMARFHLMLRQERDRLALEKAAVARAVEAKRDEVLDAWRDLRCNDQVRETARLALLRERHRSEQAEADERGLLDHVRAGAARRRG